MILHCVFCNFSADVPKLDRFAVMKALKDLCVGGADGIIVYDLEV